MALAGVGVSVRVVMADGDRVVVIDRGLREGGREVVVDGGECA